MRRIRANRTSFISSSQQRPIFSTMASCDVEITNNRPGLGGIEMTKADRPPRRVRPLVLGLVSAVSILTAAAVFAQRLPGTENGEWRYLGGDAGHTRSSPLDQINRDNFADLEVAWIWRSDNLGPNLDYFSRSNPDLRRRNALHSGHSAAPGGGD